MKKLLLAFSIIAFPLTSIAADKPERMSDTNIDAAVKLFGPGFCNKTENNIKKIAEKIYDCYQTTPKNSHHYEVCFLGDSAIISILQPQTKTTKELQKINPFGFSTFFSHRGISERIDEISNFPKYKNYTEAEKLDYYSNSTTLFFNKIETFCNHSTLTQSFN